MGVWLYEADGPLTNRTSCPAADHLISTVGKVTEGQVLKPLLSGLKTVVGKEYYGCIFPEISNKIKLVLD